ncbi:DUF1186 family protein, partial [Desulfococcaceae bacterium OttesenSCG-928-F15]|nr:DUF1186 family protein [Desulfococcaceae bacterium OttesenSCG-928-F15]
MDVGPPRKLVQVHTDAGKLAEEATGDMGIEYLHRILTSVCHGDTTLIKEMIENESVNEYFRCSAVRALNCLVATEQATRESVL